MNDRSIELFLVVSDPSQELDQLIEEAMRFRRRALATNDENEAKRLIELAQLDIERVRLLILSSAHPEGNRETVPATIHESQRRRHP